MSNNMNNDIQQKEHLCSEAERLSLSSEWKQTADRLSAMQAEWRKIKNWGMPREKELQERFNNACDLFFSRRKREREANGEKKKQLISEANSLSGSTDWKATTDKLQKLFNQWKAIGTAGRDLDNALWNEFNSARQKFFDKKSQHFKELDKQREANRRAKQDIISETRSVSQYSENWKETSAALSALMNKWKALGSAGRDHDDDLWKQFNEIRQKFFDRQEQHFNARKQEQANNAKLKQRIADEAYHIARARIYTPPQTSRMKELDAEWKKIGPCEKEEGDKLWQIFRSAKDDFWSGKRSENERNKDEWRSKMYETIQRKHEQISKLQSQIANLNYKMSSVRNQEHINNMRGWIAEKEAKIREISNSISDIERKIKESYH